MIIIVVFAINFVSPCMNRVTHAKTKRLKNLIRFGRAII